MSVPTFIDWFYAWAFGMKIEFRETCKWRDGKPSVLACDATKVGINFNNTFVAPVETSGNNHEITSSSRRYHQCFLSNPSNNEQVCRLYAKARDYLKIITKMIISHQFEILFDEEHSEATNNMITFIPEGAKDAYSKMIDVDTSNNLKVAYPLIFELLSHDASIDSVLPLRIAHECVQVMELTLLNVTDIDSIKEFAFKLKYFCSEFTQLISMLIAEYGSVGNDILHLIPCCAEMVINIHLSDVPPELASPIPTITLRNMVALITLQSAAVS